MWGEEKHKVQIRKEEGGRGKGWGHRRRKVVREGSGWSCEVEREMVGQRWEESCDMQSNTFVW